MLDQLAGSHSQRGVLAMAAAEGAHQAHCRRVAAWAATLGARMALTHDQISVLEQAALRHHAPGLAFTSAAASRLIAELRGGDGGDASAPDRTTDDGIAVDASDALQAGLHDALAGHRPLPGQRMHLLIRILEAAHHLDEWMEALPYGAGTLSEALRSLEESTSDPEWRRVIRSLRGMQSTDESQIRHIAKRLPSSPRVVAEAYRLSRDPEVSLEQLEQVASRDVSVAGLVVHAANAAIYGSAGGVRTVGQAVAHIGLDAARQLLAAAALRPLYSAPLLRPLWNHSLTAAAQAQSIAARFDVCDPKEAFLAGLVHDVGRLAFAALPHALLDTIQSLSRHGVEPVASELLICGFDHGYAGGIVLEEWLFEEDMIDAVRWHHQPERSTSRFAAVLYLTEYLLCSEEDLPSTWRLRSCVTGMRAGLRSIEDHRLKLDPSLEILQYTD